MPVNKQDAHKALELLEDYRKKLPPHNMELREALARAIIAIRSRLFQALLDINEFYTYTLEDTSKPVEVKTTATYQLAEKWENVSPPVPASSVEIAKRILHDELLGRESVYTLRTHLFLGLRTVDSSGIGEKVGGSAYVDDGNWHVENIDLKKTQKGGLGISIAGGTDNPHANDGNPGIFITKLIQGTPAEMDGRLLLGDQIASVNGTSLLNVTHVEAVRILKESDHDIELVMNVLPGLLTKYSNSQVIRRKNDREWSPISDHGTMDRKYKLNIERNDSSPLSKEPSSPRRYMDITLRRNQRGLGFSIAGGIGNEHVKDDDGIFVTKIISGGAAEEEGTLSVGDRIMQVNGDSMVSITHDEAVSILKAVKDTALLKIEKNAITISSQLNTTDEEEEEEEEEVVVPEIPKRTVVLNRPEETGLGFNIIGGEGNTGIFISYISPESVADKSGELKQGDKIIKVNGQRMVECSHEEAALALKGAGEVVTLVVQYQPSEFTDFQLRLQQLQELQATSKEPSTSPGMKPPPVKQLYVRALFDYDSTTDNDCPSHGLSFKHGDILHVLNGSDEEWWQAALVGNHADDGPQGIIPSRKRVERRTKTNQKSVKFTRGEQSFSEKDRKLSLNEKRGARTSFKLSRKLPFIKKIGSSASGGLDESNAEGDHVPTYEPVSLEPRGYARPVIILGPLKEDMNDLLVQEFPDKFAGCVPHTTREPREGEVDGRDYHFVSSVEQMERDIQAHLFIEAGRYKENLYGTSIKAVKEVANQGKHCILGVSGYAIRRLQMADLHPIAVCIRPTSVSVIQMAQPKNSDEVCKQIFDKGRRIEQEFAEYFTAIVEGDSQSDIYNKVKNIIHEQSGNYIWVPSNESL